MICQGAKNLKSQQLPLQTFLLPAFVHTTLLFHLHFPILSAINLRFRTTERLLSSHAFSFIFILQCCAQLDSSQNQHFTSSNTTPSETTCLTAVTAVVATATAEVAIAEELMDTEAQMGTAHHMALRTGEYQRKAPIAWHFTCQSAPSMIFTMLHCPIQ